MMQTLTVPPLFEELGHALSTDYFFLREQLTEQSCGACASSSTTRSCR
jgi:hypothetical protein